MLSHPTRGRVAVIALLCSIAAPQTALAREPADTAPADATAAPADASRVEALDATGASTTVEAPVAPAPDAYGEARQRVALGEKLFDEGNFDAALAEFERAYQTMLGHPARYLVLFNIGQCYEKLYRYDGAIEAYQAYLRDAGEGAEDAATVRAKMELLSSLLGRLDLRVASSDGKQLPSFELWVDGRFIGKNKTRALLPGGNHEVEIRASGFEHLKLPLQLPATTERTLKFEMKPLAKEYRGLKPAMFWTTSALALGTAIAGGAIGFAAYEERNSINAMLDQGLPEGLQICGTATPCGSDGADDPQKRIQNLATTADVFFIASGVLTVTAVVLGFMTDFSGSNAESKASPKTKVDVGLAPSGGRFTVQGAF